MSGLYIKKFIDRLQQLDMKGSKDFICPLQDAKLLHSDITKLLLDIESLKEAALKKEDIIQIELGGSDF